MTNGNGDGYLGEIQTRMDGEVFRACLEVMAQRAMEEELVRHLGAQRHERTPERKGHRNGLPVYPPILDTRQGMPRTSTVPVAGSSCLVSKSMFTLDLSHSNRLAGSSGNHQPKEAYTTLGSRSLSKSSFCLILPFLVSMWTHSPSLSPRALAASGFISRVGSGLRFFPDSSCLKPVSL